MEIRRRDGSVRVEVRAYALTSHTATTPYRMKTSVLLCELREDDDQCQTVDSNKIPGIPRMKVARLKHLSYYYDIRIMGTTKKEEFSSTQNRLADLAKALAHPARIAILEFLSKQNSCICGVIVDELPLSQSTVSQHLAELKRVGIITGNIEGPKVCYCINQKVWREAKQLLTQFLTDAKNCC